MSTGASYNFHKVAQYIVVRLMSTLRGLSKKSEIEGREGSD